MKDLYCKKWICGGLVLAGAMLMNTAPAMAQDYGYAGGYGYAQPGQFDSLVSRIALYPDPLLAQIFAAAAFPDQIAAAAQGSGGPFDPSVEALMQYPSVLQMMASDPGWTQALGQAVMQNEGAVMDAIQNLRREAQQYGYLQSGPQMQVLDQGGYIDILPVGGYMYVPMYDPYVVFARPRPGFFVGGAIRFGGGFRWSAGYNRFDWGRHQVFVNQRVWTPPARTYGSPRNGFDQRPFENSRQNFTGGNRESNRNYPAPAMQPPIQRNFPEQQRGFATAPSGRNFNRQMPQNFSAPSVTQPRSFTAPTQMGQRNFTPQQPRGGFDGQYGQPNFAPPQQQPQQRGFAATPRGNSNRQTPQNFGAPPAMQPRSFTAPRQMEQRGIPPQQHNGGGFGRGGESRGHGR
jgi:hypothetical protein